MGLSLKMRITCICYLGLRVVKKDVVHLLFLRECGFNLNLWSIIGKEGYILVEENVK